MNNNFLSVANKYLSLAVTTISDIMTEYKHRKWANKEKSLMLWEVSIIFISIFIATIIVAQLPDPRPLVVMGDADLIKLEALLKLLPDWTHFFFNLIGKIGTFFKTLSLKIRSFLGPVWDVIMFIPNKILNFIHFILLCLAKLLTSFFTLIFRPLDLISGFFDLMFGKIYQLFRFIINLPGISHLIYLITLILHNLVLLFTSLMLALYRLLEGIEWIFRSLNLDELWLHLKNFKIFNFFIAIPKAIFNFFKMVFGSIGNFFSNLLKALHLHNLLSSIFLPIYQFFLTISLWLVSFFAKLLAFLHDILIYIPRGINWFVDRIRQLHFRFLPIQFLSDFFTLLLDIIKWIVAFPIFLLRRFVGFIYYFLSSISLQGLKDWWDNLCQDQPGGCGHVDVTLQQLQTELASVKALLEQMQNQTVTHG